MLDDPGWNRLIARDIKRDFEYGKSPEVFDSNVVKRVQSLLRKAFHAISKKEITDKDISYASARSEIASKLAKKACALARNESESMLAQKARDYAEILELISKAASLCSRVNIEYRLGSSKANQIDDTVPNSLAKRSSGEGWYKEIADAKTEMLKIRYQVHLSCSSVANNAERVLFATKLVHEKASGSKYSDLCSKFAASVAIDAEDITSELKRIENVIFQITVLPRRKAFGEI